MGRLLTMMVLAVLMAVPALAEQSLGPVATNPVVSAPGDDLGHGIRGLINDGSFEFGECDAGSAWTCTSNTDCAWILDPLSIWGYPAYDGLLVAWLGGFCGEPNSNSFCQDIFFEGYCGMGFYTWKWMGYVNDEGGNMMYVTIDGTVVFEKEMTLADHTYGTWGELWFDAYDYYGTHNLCFEFVATTGANMLIDYIDQIWSPTTVEDASLSTVKSLY